LCCFHLSYSPIRQFGVELEDIVSHAIPIPNFMAPMGIYF